MIIFEYKVSPSWLAPDDDKRTSCIRVTDEQKDNVITYFFGKTYHHTLPKEEIDKIVAIINKYPGLFDIRQLEPNDVLDGYAYKFTFSNRKNPIVLSDIIFLITAANLARMPRWRSGQQDILRIMYFGKIIFEP